MQTKKNRKTPTMCKGRYALCTSAPCKKIRGKPKKTSCKCLVETGYNFATKPCNQLKTKKMKNGNRRIYSTFSINEMNDGKKITECDKKYEWSDCLNQKCKVDPKNPKRAICECILRKLNKNWLTMGANNNSKKCKTSKWSGAHKKDFLNTRNFWNGYFSKKTKKRDKIIGYPKKIINELK
jgi:hypothetical protein